MIYNTLFMTDSTAIRVPIAQEEKIPQRTSAIYRSTPTPINNTFITQPRSMNYSPKTGKSASPLSVCTHQPTKNQTKRNQIPLPDLAKRLQLKPLKKTQNLKKRLPEHAVRHPTQIVIPQKINGTLQTKIKFLPRTTPHRPTTKNTHQLHEPTQKNSQPSPRTQRTLTLASRTQLQSRRYHLIFIF